ncbi:putative recombination initiation defects 3 isoform X2 [Lotus japonicus]|uniref:putative recombination initiation defects 3 isoform X2 n=1 Tax=Lotus japonicus TaxID=34305 RepID=UPI0025833060|nr:putative recombination initiation defects 3 isoform X2 [Lotus japonicus]
MKINKACDLSSISVFPPPPLHSRRSNNVSSGMQASQHRSQLSQQSFSQGFSSQHGLLSNFSQSSLDEAVTTNDQRMGSQEYENSSKKISSLPRLTYSREESQPPNSRSSGNLMVKWNSADPKSQLSEGLEHRIGMMETSLSRFAMILDSVQSDVMQVNKGTKEMILDMDYIRQKLIAQDNSLQLMTKGQEDIKARIDGSLKSVTEQLSQVTNNEKLQEVYLMVSAFPQLFEASLRNVQTYLHNTTKEMQEISCSLKNLNPKNLAQPILSSKEISGSLKNLNPKNLAQPILSSKSISKQATPPKMRQPPVSEVKMRTRAAAAPKVKMGGWMSVKKEVTFSDRISEKVQKKKEPCSEKIVRGGRDCAIVIESDEEDGAFSCLVEENAVPIRRSKRNKQSPSYLEDFQCRLLNSVQSTSFSSSDLFGNITKEEEEETQRILQKARRRKRKYNNVITI